MSRSRDAAMLETLLDSWDRNNTILLNLLRIVPEGGLEARLVPDSPSVAELFSHMSYVRLAFVYENAPELANGPLPEEYANELNRDRIARSLDESAKAVREAVRSRVESGQPLNLHYDHPIHFMQHMIWHEGYHHGQIKLTLKATGRPITDRQAGRPTWGVWMLKTREEAAAADAGRS